MMGSNFAAARLLLLLVVIYSFIYTASGTSDLKRSLDRRAPIADGIKLRVLPIGDSITRGSGNPSAGGYRRSLYSKLAARGNMVEFVGSLNEGSFVHNRHEGHRGKMIQEIEQLSENVGMISRPNLAFLHAGTNDMDRGDAGAAPERLEKLIRTIIKFSPNVVVFVAQIVPSTNPATMSRINAFNDRIPGIVRKLANEDLKVALVDMRGLTSADLYDELHPNDRGYEKMANEFYDAVEKADEKGWIKMPQKPDLLSGESCHDPDSWQAPVTIAMGPRRAHGDGDWSEGWIKRGVVAQGNCPRRRLHFMDLNGDGIMDYACVDEDTGAVHVNIGMVNSDGKKEDLWGGRRKVASGRSGRKGSGVKFADLNGDGRSDYVYLDEGTGEVHGWINDGPGASDGGYKWRSLGVVARRGDAKSANLHFHDFNGDGRDDFLLINQKTGEVRGWINRGDRDKGDMPMWHALGVIATGATQVDGKETVFMGDFTGEGRADYLIVRGRGETVGFINHLQEGSMIPSWKQPIPVAAGPDGATREEVRFADLDGDGDVDYLLVDRESGEIRMWENNGSGGRYQAGDGTMFADLDGDGVQDYLWVDHQGNAYGYLNVGEGTDSWEDLGLLVEPGRPYVRPGYAHAAVLTRSGRADYIAIDKETGRAQWWRNTGSRKNYKFEYAGEAARGVGERIRNDYSGYGWEFDARNIRFADLDGDGLDDYLYISDFGAVLWWKNRGVEPINWDAPKQVADGPGIMAQDVRFADIDGDGKLDYVVLSEISGHARVWINRGFIDNGARIRWARPVQLARGPVNVVGRDVRLLEMTGDSRADYVALNPVNGAARMWRSRCSRLDYSWNQSDCAETRFDGLNDADQRWHDARTDALFDVTMACWADSDNDKDEFSRTCSSFWGTSEEFDCGVRSNRNGCDSYESCDDGTAPAKTYLYNSFVKLNMFFGAMYDGILAAKNSISDAERIAEAFETPPRDENLGIMLDVLEVSYTLFGSKAWANLFSTLGDFKDMYEKHEVVQEGLNEMVTRGMGAMRDYIEDNGPNSDAKEVLGLSLESIAERIQQSITNFQASLFDGTPESISILQKITANGALLGRTPESDYKIQKDFQKALYAVLIPQAWLLSKDDIYPVILKTTYECDGTESEDENPFDDGAVWICRDGFYWRLTMAKGGKGKACTPVNCNDNGEPQDPDICNSCIFNGWKTPPGANKLSSDDWGGLKKEELIQGAINTWEANGRKNDANSRNGKGLAKPATSGFKIKGFDVTDPGVVTIPVCSQEAARRVWEDEDPDDNDNFPCP